MHTSKPNSRKKGDGKAREKLLKELNAIREKEVELLSKISEIGLDDREIKALHDEINTLSVDLHNKDDELQVQKEELKVQTDELEAQLEELRATNEELEKSILKRKLAEELLKKSQDNLKLVLESTDEGIIEVDSGCICRLANASASSMLGFTQDEIIGKQLHGLIHHSHADGTPCLIEQCGIMAAIRIGEKKSVSEDVFFRKNGVAFPVEYSAYPISEDNAVVGAVISFKDISLRKEAERKLAYVASFPENNPTPIIEVDDKGAITYSNLAADRLFPDLRSMGAAHPFIAGIGLEMFKNSQKGLVTRDVRTDGTFYHQTILYVPKTRTFRIYCLDITERKELEDELQQKNEELEVQAEELEVQNEEIRTNNEELMTITRSLKEREASLRRMAAVVEDSNDAVALLDLDGNILAWNRGAREMYGYSEKEALHRNILGIVPEGERRKDEAMMSRLRKGEPVKSFETRRIAKDGRILDVWLTATALKDEGGKIYALATTERDITGRKHTEKELQEQREQLEVQAEELRSQTEELSDKNYRLESQIRVRKQVEEELEEAKAQAELYLDLMGHDISNMHQIAMGQLELAREVLNIEGKLEAGDRELIDTSIATLERSARLIENVRNLQKLRSGELKEETIDLDEMLASVVGEFESLLHGGSIRFMRNGPRLIKANKLLHDVFANLIGNAIKHSGNSVDILVDLKEGMDSGKDVYMITVEDNGPGIPDDLKGRIFNRLQRGETRAKGMGLGLYLVKSLSESFKGRVWVENRVPGDYTKGSRFVVVLPAGE